MEFVHRRTPGGSRADTSGQEALRTKVYSWSAGPSAELEASSQPCVVPWGDISFRSLSEKHTRRILFVIILTHVHLACACFRSQLTWYSALSCPYSICICTNNNKTAKESNRMDTPLKGCALLVSARHGLAGHLAVVSQLIPSCFSPWAQPPRSIFPWKRHEACSTKSQNYTSVFPPPTAAAIWASESREIYTPPWCCIPPPLRPQWSHGPPAYPFPHTLSVPPPPPAVTQPHKSQPLAEPSGQKLQLYRPCPARSIR